MLENWKEKLNWDESGGVGIHDARNVKGFFGDYRFLSNFADAEVWFEGQLYLTSEAAYQAAKVLPPYRIEIARMTAREAKKGWKQFPRMYNDEVWASRKFEIMRGIVFEKFHRNRGLRSALLLTGDKFLEETNWWKDQYWGVDNNLGGGLNNLGHILMATRAYFRTQEVKGV